MPIYEYRCENCGHQLDALQKVADAPLTDCPECNTAGLRKLISAVGFRLKGGGWYETDFKKDGDKKRNLADAPKEKSGGDGGSGGDKKSDSKKESKPAKETKKPASKAAGSSS